MLLRDAGEGKLPGRRLLLGRRPVPGRLMGYKVVGSHFSSGSLRVTRQMTISSVTGKVLKSH